MNQFHRYIGMVLRLGLVTAMVLCLACTAQHSLSYLATSPDLRQSSFRLEFREAEAENPPVNRRELRLEDLVIDGRRLRFRVSCRDDAEAIGEGFHERMIVDIDRFMARLARKQPSG